MIRWAIEDDRPDILTLLHTTHDNAQEYNYKDFAGTVLVYRQGTRLIGFIAFTLGRPETWIRHISVAPAYQNKGFVAKHLMAGVIKLALAHGSQGLEGFQTDKRAYLQEMSSRTGAVLQPGVRVRWPLTQEASPKAQRLKRDLLKV